MTGGSLPLWWALLLAGAPRDARDEMGEGTLDEAREWVTLFVLAGGSWQPGSGGNGYGDGYSFGSPGYGDGDGDGNGNGFGSGAGDGHGNGGGSGSGTTGVGFGFGGGNGDGGAGCYGYGDGGTGILEVTHGGRTWTPRQVLEALLEATG